MFRYRGMRKENILDRWRLLLLEAPGFDWHRKMVGEQKTALEYSVDNVLRTELTGTVGKTNDLERKRNKK